MASGLQCPGCGHVHPAGLPEIVRGDTTFRCYGCYRTLSVPEGWSGRPSSRPAAPAPASAAVGDAPPGSGTRDARAARLAARRAARAGVGQVPIPGADDTQMVSTVGPDGGASSDPRSASGPSSAGRDWSAAGATSAGRDWSASGGSSAQPNWSAAGAAAVGAAGAGGARGGAGARAPLGWRAPRRSGRPVPTPIRALVWAAAFGVGLAFTVVVLKEIGVLDVNTAIDLYAGSGIHRFSVLLVMLPVWALLSATIAHFSLEALARRRRSPAPDVTRPPAGAPTSP